MSDRARQLVKFMSVGAAWAFVFPFATVLFMAGGLQGLATAAMAGAINALTGGPAFTFIFAFVVPYTKRFPFLPAIIVQIASFLVTGVVLLSVNIDIVVAINAKKSLFDREVLGQTYAILTDPRMVRVMSLGTALFFVTAMGHQVARKLGGYWVIIQWFLGKYHRPREETRVFMFLDLKDSTPLAEKLGSLEFSALVQDFFNDLSLPVFATKAAVSHYIGDEAVIVWPPSKAFRDDNCVRIFFRMQEEIAKRADYYLRRYGVVPSFKAGVHIGPVVAAEVGRAKSEIVYHGDAVNTTARIVGLCAPLGRDLLVSKEIADRLEEPSVVKEPLGSHALKGKSEPVELVAIDRGAVKTLQKR